ncbi:hypothetical protein ACFSTA_03330 [Ornithinibacillus salinisoli]|uniref:Uncharacterized protein n=1 Tax=Ornithinibacillus salinisoli TaxID=1848459 RepID=A0ABW4VVX5_9BACI
MRNLKGIEWIGLILMVAAAVVYWITKYNDQYAIWTNVSIVCITLGAVIIAISVFVGKRNNR